MTLKTQDVREWLKRHDIDPTDIRHGIRIVTSGESDAFLEYTRFKLNSEGKRFIDDETGEAATETNLVPLRSFPWSS